MIASIVLSALALARLAQAAVSPLTPTSAQAGSSVTLEWTADPTGTWTDMTIELMSGSNWEMVQVAPIASGINGVTQTSLAWNVPEVDPYSAIYFIQYTINNGQDPQWTTRFLIESPTDESTPPVSSIQPDGQTIAWGVGSLAGAAGPTSSGSASGSVASSAILSSSSEASSVMSSASSDASSVASSITSSASFVASSGMSRMSSARSAASSSASNVFNANAASGAEKVYVQAAGVAAMFVAGLAML